MPHGDMRNTMKKVATFIGNDEEKIGCLLENPQ